MRRLFVLGVVVGWVGASGCSLRPAPRAPMAVYDLASPSAEAGVAGDATLPVVFVIHEPTGPLWLDGASMYYRLEYDERERLRRFANSQWAISPLRLLGAALRAGLAPVAARGGALPDVGIAADYSLRVAVEDFSQVFATKDRSGGVVRLRVVLVRNRGHAFLGQRTFEAQSDAPTPDARGGVAALERASAGAVAQAVAWIVETVRKDLE